MSKRVALICQGKSEDYSKKHKDFRNLPYLNNDVKRISKTLKRCEWHIDTIKIEHSTCITDKLDEYQDSEEILLYYTGHGHIDIDTTPNEFNLVGQRDENISLAKSIRNSEIDNTKIILIIDACHSGTVIENLPRDSSVETITATTSTKFAYSETTEEMSFFTLHFCKYIDKKIKNRSNTDIFLKDIANHIDGQKNSKGYKQKVKYHYSDDRGMARSIIVNPSELIKEEFPESKRYHITIELVPIDNGHYDIWVWMKSDNNEFDQIESENRSSIEYKKIAQEISKIINIQYKDIPSKEIYLYLVLPINLIQKNIDLLKLSNTETIFSRFNKFFIRGRERFRDVGQNMRRDEYRIVDWKNNWGQYESKRGNSLDEISYPLVCVDNDIYIDEVADKPFVVIEDKKHTEETFKKLYRAGVPLAIWANKCENSENFKSIIKDFKDEKLGNIHKKMSKLKIASNGLQGNIMLLYDNPNFLPPDEGKDVQKADVAQFYAPM